MMNLQEVSLRKLLHQNRKQKPQLSYKNLLKFMVLPCEGQGEAPSGVLTAGISIQVGLQGIPSHVCTNE